MPKKPKKPKKKRPGLNTLGNACTILDQLGTGPRPEWWDWDTPEVFRAKMAMASAYIALAKEQRERYEDRPVDPKIFSDCPYPGLAKPTK